MNQEISICRTCLTPTRAQFCRIITEYDDSDILEMLSYSIPELDMYLVSNPAICNECFDMLETTFKFKSRCLNNEERLLKYTQKFGINKVDFSDYFKHINPEKLNLINNNYRKTPLEHSLKQKSKNKGSTKSTKYLNCKKCRGCILQDSSNPFLHLKVNISPFICDHCKKQFEQMGDLRKHMLGHTKQRRCQLCEKSFRDLHMLQKHLWSHTGVKPFACHLCPKQFQQKHCLKQHIQHHQGSDNISCRICKKLFSTKYNAKVHMKTAHKVKEYCDLCGQSFRTKTELVKHLQNDSRSCVQIADKTIQQKENDKKFLIHEPDSIPQSTMTIKVESLDEQSKESNEEDVSYETVIKEENDSAITVVETVIMN